MKFRRLHGLAASSIFATFVASAASLAAAGCAVPVASEGEVAADESVASAASRAKVPVLKLVVTVDWEGTDLADANLSAMEDFRASYPDVRIVHFLNAAYYTKKGANAAAVTRAIGRVIRPGDELGLHIHGWKRLFEASGVTFRSGPTFWGDTLGAADCTSDCGHEVPISLYTSAELEKVMAFSVDTLAAHGFGRAQSFRAGGWLDGETVRGALEDQGFAYDHSAVPPGFLANELRGDPLLDWVRELWTGTTASAQPYRLGGFTEIPDNGALADYVTAREMLTVVDGAITTLKKTPGDPRVVSIGFHQETATDYLPRVIGALDGIAQRVAAGKVTVRYVTSKEAAAAR